MKARSRTPLVLLILMALFFFTEEAAIVFLPGAALPRALFKGLASLCPAALCLLGTRRNPGRLHAGLCAALLCCLVGDVTINLSMLAGIVFFAGAHVLLCAVFWRAAPPVRWQIALWAALSALFITLAILLRARTNRLLAPVIAYILVLTAMLSLSLRLHPQLRAGAIIFALSDFLLALNAVVGKTTLSHFIALGVYYIAVGILALLPWRAAKNGQA